MTLNINKTKYIIFCSNKKDVNTDSFRICIGNSILEEVSSFQYLGVTLDSHLHWQQHIINTCKKLTYACYVLLKARQCFDTPTMKLIYFAIFHSHLTYCIEAWGVTYDTYLLPLIKLQKRALRILTYSHYSQPSHIIFHQLHIFTFLEIKQYKIACLINNILKWNNPLPANILIKGTRLTRANTSGHFNIPRSHNVYGERLMQSCGTKIWKLYHLQSPSQATLTALWNTIFF